MTDLENPSTDDNRFTLPILFIACILVSSCAASIGPSKVSVDVRTFLNDSEMDSITAGGAVRVGFDLSSSAKGLDAVTSTQGSITTVRSTVLRVQMDPRAPEPARARSLGLSPAELIFASGRADATGTNSVQCSATPNAFGDAAYVAQSAKITPLSAACACAGFGIGIVP